MAPKSVVIYASSTARVWAVAYVCVSLGLQGKSKVRASGPFYICNCMYIQVNYRGTGLCPKRLIDGILPHSLHSAHDLAILSKIFGENAYLNRSSTKVALN